LHDIQSTNNHLFIFILNIKQPKKEKKRNSSAYFSFSFFRSYDVKKSDIQTYIFCPIERRRKKNVIEKLFTDNDGWLEEE